MGSKAPNVVIHRENGEIATNTGNPWLHGQGFRRSPKALFHAKIQQHQGSINRAGIRSTTMRLRIALDLRHDASCAPRLLIHIAMPSSEANSRDNLS
ncbi:hypothetical protein [Bifidobacterium longum]|uniref:hypothetical protein n=1 Tax=Bifidobacterium longum TaxID=216816 RepID=UPI001F17A4E0|nr:hypothetical protein [Bifidobacterium longum]